MLIYFVYSPIESGHRIQEAMCHEVSGAGAKSFCKALGGLARFPGWVRIVFYIMGCLAQVVQCNL